MEFGTSRVLCRDGRPDRVLSPEIEQRERMSEMEGEHRDRKSEMEREHTCRWRQWCGGGGGGGGVYGVGVVEVAGARVEFLILFMHIKNN